MKSNENLRVFWKLVNQSTRMRMGNSVPNYHEVHIAGKGINSVQHYNLVHKFILIHQAMKIPAAKAAVDKEWEKLEKISALNLTKIRSKKEVIDEARTKGAKVHFASLMDMCHFEKCWVGGKAPKKWKLELYSEVILWKMIRCLMQYSTNKDLQYLKWQQLKSWISSPECLVAMNNQRTKYQLKPKWKRKMLTNCPKFPNRNVQTFAFVHLDTNGQNHGPVWKTQLYLLKGICTVILWQDYYGKGSLRNPIETWLGEHSKLGMSHCASWKRNILIRVCGWHKIGWKETKSWSDVETTQQRSRFGRTNIFPGDKVK